MAITDKKQLKLDIFESIGEQLSAYGFKLKPPKDSFIRSREGKTTEIFQLVCLDGKPGWRIQPNVALRFEQVEDIFHQTSEFELKHQKDTPTIGGAIGNILKNDNRACEFLLESESHIAPVTEKIVQVFREFALPYFDKFKSLIAVDAELNTKPTERTPHRVAPWLRCSTGIIVAKLIGRPDYQHLADVYTDVMTRSDKGFYLKSFRALLKSLEFVEV
jgi:hypothetical protein